LQTIKRKIRSFVKREGRMTLGQSQAYEAMMPLYGFEYKKALLDFKQLFANDAPVSIEVGFGMGSSLIEQAARYPERNYIGIEVHRPGVGALLLKMKEQSLTNIRVSSADAVEVLTDMIPNDSIELLQLFFPDPWHKRRHHKRRIVKDEFVSLLHSKIQLNGHYHMATDWQDYAKHMLKVMQASQGWENCSESNDYIPQPENRPITKFQKRGEGLGHGVWDLMFKRVALKPSAEITK
jgi:tRNA (guanine-N7-)-methyltransferase